MEEFDLRPITTEEEGDEGDLLLSKSKGLFGRDHSPPSRCCILLKIVENEIKGKLLPAFQFVKRQKETQSRNAQGNLKLRNLLSLISKNCNNQLKKTMMTTQ
jgi:hypothetical protein